MLRRLTAAEVRPETDAGALGFADTDELDPRRDGIGQDRAVRAIRFGLAMGAPGYHLFVLGAPETERRLLVDRLAADAAADRETPDDLLYLHDFETGVRPRALRLPAGHGRRLREDAEHFVEELRSMLPSLFREDEFRERIAEIASGFEREQKAMIDELRAAAEAEGLALLQTPRGFAFAPAQNGRVLDKEAFEALDEATRKRLADANERLTAQLLERMQDLPSRQQDMLRAQREVARELVAATVQQLVRGLRRRWHEQPRVIAWLDAVEADAIAQAQTILALEQQADGPRPPGAAAAQDAFYARYRVNLLVDHGDARGAPVVFEGNPTLENLVGRIDHRSEYGNLTTDFTLVRAGALQRAAGGMLILEAERLLGRPFAWEALKRALFDGEVRPENAGEQLGFGRTSTLEAEPLALDLKVVLLGQRRTYYLLSSLEPDFAQLFKVPADLEDRIERTGDNALRYARSLAALVAEERLRPVTAAAVARILDHGVRLAGDAERLTAHAQRIGDLLREADQYAAEAGAERIEARHVTTAIDQGRERLDRIRRDVHERIDEGTVRIATEGTAVGEINGLSVLQIGESGFGQPSRITASARLGRGEVIDIEREVRLGGPIHSKAVMILTAFVGRRYAPRAPLSLAATLVFEQSYGGIEGDSATVAEVCALLSAIGDLPLRQDLAVTGSMDQHGRVQAVGGANEKIEGFFEVCAARGLSGTQGVLLPAANARHLMLRSDVAEAVADDRFAIHVVEEIEDALELLTGLPRGRPEGDGWSEDSFDARVASGLAAFRTAARSLREEHEHTVEREPAAAPEAPPPGPPPGPEDQP